MKIKSRSKDPVTVLDLQGNIMGGPDAEKFEEQIALLKEEGKTDVVLNLKKVTWINSSGVGIILGGFTSLIKAGGRMKVAEMSERIDNLFYTLRLRQLIEMYDTEDEAVASFEES
jgi:anti-sigma B factor antagonist